MSGIRAEITVQGTLRCPVADAADQTGGTATSVTWTGTDETPTTEQFELSAGTDDGTVPDGMTQVFERDDAAVYRFERDQEDCVCERIEALGCPVSSVRAAPDADADTTDTPADGPGRLQVTLHAADAAELRQVMADLDEHYDVELRSLVRDGGSGAGDDGGNPTVVDRGRLTDRQREVLRTAHRMGYFAYPRDANATQVADELGIDPSTLAEHLAAAQSKLMDAIVEA